MVIYAPEKYGHIIHMLIGCVLPFLLIFLLPLFGVSEGVTLLVFIVLMFASHLSMMRGAQHGVHGSNDTNHRLKGNGDAHF